MPEDPQVPQEQSELAPNPASNAMGNGAQEETTQAGPQAGNVPPNQVDASMRQMKEGAKQFASGMKDFYDQNVAPAANDAFTTAKNTMRETQSENATNPHVAYGPVIIAGAGALGVISLFLPIAHIFGFSINFFSDYVGSEGVFLLILMLANTALGVITVIQKKRGLLIAAGIVGVIGGLFSISDGFGSMVSLSVMGASVGVGLILLGLAGVAMIVGAVLTFMQLRSPKPQNYQPPVDPNSQR